MDMYTELSNLQIDQQRHDDLAHRDILALDVRDRVKHMVLHFAKYSGHFATVHETRDEAKFVATLVDTFIISLACANALRFRLSDLLLNAPRRSSADLGVGDTLASVMTTFFPRFAKVTGTMAKACESMDHFERLDYHAIFEKGLAEITSMCIATAQKTNIDLIRLTRDRWASVERKAANNPEIVRESAKVAIRRV